MKKLTTVVWDEHKTPIVECPILEKKTKNHTWFYIKDNDFNVYVLYHNLVL